MHRGSNHDRGRYQGRQHQGRCPPVPLMDNLISQQRFHNPVQSHEGMRNNSWQKQSAYSHKVSHHVNPWITEATPRPGLLPTPIIAEAPFFNNIGNVLQMNGMNGNAVEALTIPAFLQQGLQNLPQLQRQILASTLGVSTIHDNSNPRLNVAQFNTGNPVNMLSPFSNSSNDAAGRDGLVNPYFNQQSNNQSIIQQPHQPEPVQNKFNAKRSYGNRTKPRRARSTFPMGKNHCKSRGPPRNQPEAEQTNNESASNPESRLNGHPAGPATRFRLIQQRIRRNDTCFGGAPSDTLFCHICKKPFGGSKQSLVEHLGGRPHREKVRETEAKYIKELNELRHKAKLFEQQKQSALKNIEAAQCHYCDVCDLHFVGDLNEHEHSKNHESLQVYYKPRCERCNMTFPTRVKYEEHISSIEHIEDVGPVNYADNKRETDASKEAKTEVNENAGVKEVKKESQTENTAAAPTKERGSEENQNTVQGVNIKISSSPLKQADSTTSHSPSIAGSEAEPRNSNREQGTKRKLRKEPKHFPPWDPNIKIGEDFVKPKSGWMCSLCTSFLPTEKTVHLHLTSKIHYEKYILRLKKSKRESSHRKNGEEASKTRSFEIENNSMEHKDNETTAKDNNFEEPNDWLSKSTFEQYLENKTHNELSSTRSFTRTSLPLDNNDADEDDGPESDGNWKRQRLVDKDLELLPSDTASERVESSNYEVKNEVMNQPYPILKVSRPMCAPVLSDSSPVTTKTGLLAASSNEVPEDADYIVGSIDEDLLNM